MTDDALHKAEAAVSAAENNTVAVQLAMAAIELAKTAQQQPQHQSCQHPPQEQFNVKKWLVIGGVVVSVGMVAALFALAIAIGACCATGCLLVLRSMWRDYRKGR
ncbi:hypothetical protein [Streptomyces sp. NPDC020607]|uniref:hypothetical protein n=1 Tax=Streptomyces sp. NPDC020607 TaxID=3365082 RepID=UPI0037A0D9B5